MVGFEDFGLASKDQKFYEVASILNTALARTGYKTIPTLVKEKSIGRALETELGLWATKESREYQSNLYENLPEELKQSLEALTRHQEAALKDGGVDAGPSTKINRGNILRNKSLLDV